MLARFHRWFRQGGATLLCAFIFFSSLNLAYGDFAKAPISRIDSESESGLVLCKSVAVFHVENQEGITDPLAKVSHVGVGQIVTADTIDPRIFLRGKGYAPWFGKCMGHQIVFAVADDFNPNVNCCMFDLYGGVTAIQECESDVNGILFSSRINSEVLNRQSTGEFVFKGFFADKSGYLLNGLHVLAGFVESPSESGDGDSSKRRNNPFNRVKGFADLDQNEWREVIGGAIFVAGLGFLAYLLRHT